MLLELIEETEIAKWLHPAEGLYYHIHVVRILQIVQAEASRVVLSPVKGSPIEGLLI